MPVWCVLCYVCDEIAFDTELFPPPFVVVFFFFSVCSSASALIDTVLCCCVSHISPHRIGQNNHSGSRKRRSYIRSSLHCIVLLLFALWDYSLLSRCVYSSRWIYTQGQTWFFYTHVRQKGEKKKKKVLLSFSWSLLNVVC